MSTTYLLDFYQQLPEPNSDEDPADWNRRLHVGLERFRQEVEQRYTEGTLQRLLAHTELTVRRAAVLALGLLGSMESNASLSVRLRDDDDAVRHLAADALWAVWFRGDSDDNNHELARLRHLGDLRGTLSGLNKLLHRAPAFAEAYNQRAIIYFQLQQYVRSVADCEKVLMLNPFHFGAQAGLGQCFLHLNEPREALKAFRAAQTLNPNLDGVAQTIRALERTLDGQPRDEE